MATKRGVILADLHCGNLFGLTPPGWWSTATTLKHQRLYWDWYKSNIRRLGKLDFLFANGDLIDGKGERAGGTETIEPDRNAQVDMACECIKVAKQRDTKLTVTYGTPYHAGGEEDWEAQIADRLEAEAAGGHEWVNVNGTIFDLKHKVGSSSIPHGRMTAIARDRLWSLLWSTEANNSPRSHVIIRSHVHYYGYCGGANWLGMTTPALQGLGTKYGVRQCSGLVDFGFVYFEVTGKGEYTWQPILLPLREARVHVGKV